MVKVLLLGLTVMLSTLAGSYAAMKLSGNAVPTSAKDDSADSAIIKLDPVSVPVVRGGRIQGYVLARIAFATTTKEMRNKELLTLYVSEAVFRSVYEEETLDFANMKPIQVEALAHKILVRANARIGRPAAAQIIVDSLNFLAHEAVRCQQVK